MTTPGIWRLEYRKRPFTVNQVYGKMSYQQRAKLVKEWREAFAWAAIEAKMPKDLDRIRVLAWQVIRDHRVPDVGACSSAVKAAIDGLVDAGVIVDDDPRRVELIAFGSPQEGAGYDSLRLQIEHSPYPV